MPQRAFSLVELLVVIAIIAVLLGISFVVYQRARNSARSAACIANVRQVGMAILSHAGENNNKLIALQGAPDPNTGKRPAVWTVQLARAGFLSQWDGVGDAPCGTGVWTCPDCEFVSNSFGGYGVVEGAMFVYEELKPIGVSETGSLRLSRITNLSRTWLVGDSADKATDLKKGWYAIWSQPTKWSSHTPAARHGGKVNVCMADGHVETVSITEIKNRKLTDPLAQK